jgi:sodium-dependent dicarboxylate transporter 2/3/5
MTKNKIYLILIALVLFILTQMFPIFSNSQSASNMFSIVVVMAFLWLTEALPLGVTALLPLVLYPILQIESTGTTSTNYINSTIFLFMGGFFLSIAMEKWNLHKRLALNLLKLLGTSKHKIILGFLLSTALMSMFLSNTATAMIMLPIALSIILKVESHFDDKIANNFSKALLLTIAYSASIGGVATLIGTPTNLVFVKIYKIAFPNLPEITFTNWLIYGIPISFGMSVLLFLLINLTYLQKLPNKLLEKNDILEQITLLERMQPAEKKILVIFIITVILWIFRIPIELGGFVIPGWSTFLGLEKFIDDGTIAIFGALLLFIIPANFKDMNLKILDSHSISKVPWEIILLFGGGFALASGFEHSGLSKEIALKLNYMNELPLFVIILSVSLIVVTLTEFSSNTATAATTLPIIASLSQVLNINPLILMVPATISASLAFMLPISTPPNAIIFSSGRIKISEMAKVGIYLNILGIIFITIYFSIFK